MLQSRTKNHNLFKFVCLFACLFISSPQNFFFITFRERGRERETHMDAREKHRSVASRSVAPRVCPDQGSRIKPTTEVCVLTRNRTSNLLVTEGLSTRARQARAYWFKFKYVNSRKKEKNKRC